MGVFVNGKECGYVVIEHNTKLQQLLNKTITSLTEEDVKDVTQIPIYAFYNCDKLKSIVLPNTLQTIEQYAFCNCNNIENNIKIPEAVTTIGNYAFQNCSKLTGDLVLSDNIINLGYQAFNNCENIENVYIGKNITSIGMYTFQGCKKCSNLTISPDSKLKTIGNSAFRHFGSETESSFELILPSTLTNIDSYAFDNTIIKSVSIPNGVIGNYAFSNTPLDNVILGTGVTSIENSAFSNCRNLTSITIPSSVTSIESRAFNFCLNLQNVYFKGQAPDIQNNTFRLCNSVTKYDFRNCLTVPSLASSDSLEHAIGCQIIIPDALYDEWTTATNWVSLTNVVWVKASEYIE